MKVDDQYLRSRDAVAPVYRSALVPPRAPTAMVRRDRVTRLIDHAVDRTLVVVGAPAGYGKTVALSDWCAGVGADVDVAWMTLDERDTSPERFWYHLLAAVEQVAPDALAETRDRFRRQEPPVGQMFVGHLVNDLCRTSRPTVIVVDDFGVADPDTLRDLTDLIAHLPPNVHMVLACRADPLLPLVRWRADGTMSEIRASDLRFTDAEAEAFLDVTVADEIDAAQRARLRRRCDGWIAGLHLATLGVHESADPNAFIDHLEGTFSPIVDYLVTEVVNALHPHLRQFALDTSILVELTVPRCDAVAGRTDSRAVLAGMARSGVFLAASTAPDTYRYHPLFRAALITVLKDEDAARFAQVHLRAARWSMERGLVRDAVLHAVAAEDHALALRWLSEHADRLLMSGRDVLSDLLRHIPADVVGASGILLSLRARSAIVRGSLPDLDRLLSRTERPVPRHETSARVTLAAASLAGQFDESLQLLAEPAATRVPATVRDLAAGKALTALGRLDEGAHHLRLALDQRGTDQFVDVAASSLLAWNRVVAGHLRAGRALALATVDRAAAVGIRWFREVRFSELALAHVAYDRGQLEDAYRTAQTAVEASDHCALSWVEGSILLARVEWALGNRQRSRDVIGAAFVGPDERPLTGGLSLRLALTRAELHLKERNPELAEAWLPDWRTRVDRGPSSPFERLVLARFLIADDRHAAARELLTASCDATTRILVEGWRLDAIAAAGANDPTAPMALEISYSLAEPEGFAQGYVEDAPGMAKITRSGDVGVTATVGVAHSALADRRANTVIATTASTVTLVDELTDRELDILRLLPSRLSNSEIANELFVSVNTVKSHVKNIYRKLDVTSRDEAVAKATELRLM